MLIPWWSIPLLMLWLLWCVQSVLCAVQCRKLRNRLNRGNRPSYHAFRPPAVVIVPMKGLDTDAVANLHGLFRQDYPRYRILFAIEGESDPATSLVRHEAAKYSGVPWEIVFTGKADAATGQKVHNLTRALEHLEATRTTPRDRDEAWAFADADAVPGPPWLGLLIGPLVQHESNAVTTGYRWLIPQRGMNKDVRWGSRFASVINSAIACFAVHDPFTRAWGGSTAMLARTADEGGLLKHWKGAVSDDYQVSAMARALGKRVYFLPDCLVETPVDWSMKQFAEFARRQYLITRVHEPGFFAKGVASVALYVAGFVSAVLTCVLALLLGETEVGVTAGVAIAFVVVADQVRAVIRQQVVRQAFGNGTFERLRPALHLDQWGTPVVMVVNLALMLSSYAGRTMTWRGNRYRLAGPQQVTLESSGS